MPDDVRYEVDHSGQIIPHEAALCRDLDGMLLNLFSQFGWSCEITERLGSYRKIAITNVNGEIKTLNVFRGTIRNESRNAYEKKMQLGTDANPRKYDKHSTMILGIYVFDEMAPLEEAIIVGFPVDDNIRYETNPSLRGGIYVNQILVQAKNDGFVYDGVHNTVGFRPEFAFFYLNHFYDIHYAGQVIPQMAEENIGTITTVESEKAEVIPNEPYCKKDFLDDVFLTEKEYDELVSLLYYKKNVILQGAPGVGKTFLAKRLAYSILGYISKSHVEMVQFHQNYSYEDFIMGYKPAGESFELQEGVFFRFCKRAAAKPGEKFFFIIDEINRGNLSKIFGELMLLIEHDKRDEQVALAYRNEKFNVPGNVYIIGMMNTADRSLALLDYALRRRFSFFEVAPAFGRKKFSKHLMGQINDADVVDMINKRLSALNEIIADEDRSGLGRGFCIGHSYFCTQPVASQTPAQWYESIVKYEISPLLDEYWWDDKDKAEECKKELLGE